MQRRTFVVCHEGESFRVLLGFGSKEDPETGTEIWTGWGQVAGYQKGEGTPSRKVQVYKHPYLLGQDGRGTKNTANHVNPQIKKSSLDYDMPVYNGVDDVAQVLQELRYHATVPAAQQTFQTSTTIPDEQLNALPEKYKTWVQSQAYQDLSDDRKRCQLPRCTLHKTQTAAGKIQAESSGSRAGKRKAGTQEPAEAEGVTTEKGGSTKRKKEGNAADQDKSWEDMTKQEQNHKLQEEPDYAPPGWFNSYRFDVTTVVGAENLLSACGFIYPELSNDKDIMEATPRRKLSSTSMNASLLPKLSDGTPTLAPTQR
ncbi:hypothetical protein M8818_004121 [Zalaria obscura]|uniref:Uncharacterized protein n=1 Tax=Zalaria obscura TaxID=2024903 RepID=A0ACC3SE55_9PEZI